MMDGIPRVHIQLPLASVVVKCTFVLATTSL